MTTRNTIGRQTKQKIAHPFRKEWKKCPAVGTLICLGKKSKVANDQERKKRKGIRET